MQKIFNLILVGMFISFSFCEEGEGYHFVNTLYEKSYIDMETFNEFSFGRYDYISTFSGRLTNEVQKTEPVANNRTIIQTWSNIIASSRRNDKVKPNHEAQKLNGASYTIIIDSTGVVESMVGNNDVAKESLEQMGSMSDIFGYSNYVYPFGSDSLRKVGDTWTVSKEKKTEAPVFGLDKFKGTIHETTTYTFKKLKKKKGELIAYIKTSHTYELKGVGTNWDETIEFTQTGELKGEMRFNITKGVIVRGKNSGRFYGRGKSLDDDKSRSFSMNIDIGFKQKIK